MYFVNPALMDLPMGETHGHLSRGSGLRSLGSLRKVRFIPGIRTQNLSETS